jgi:predicted PurR-regulated permease PerM
MNDPSPVRDPSNARDPRRPWVGRSEPVDKGFVMVLVASIAIFLFFYKISIILLPFVISAIVAFICTPIVEWLNRRLHLPRLLASAIVFLALALLGGLIGFLAVPPLINEVTQLVANFQQVLETLMTRLFGNAPIQFLGHPTSPVQIADMAVNGMRDFLQQNGRLLLIATAGIAGFFTFFLGWVLLFYFLADGPRIARGLVWVVPPSRRQLVQQILPVMAAMLRRYFTGVAVVVLYTSIAAYFGLGLFLHLGHAVILAILTGILETIPVVGPAASAIMGGLAAMNRATTFANILEFGLYLLVLRVSIDQILGPIVLGKAARVSPVLVMFCFLSGAVLFGITGVILAVPFALSIKVILEAVYGDPLG